MAKIAIKEHYDVIEKLGYTAISGGGRVPLPDEWVLEGSYTVKILGRKAEPFKGISTKSGFKWGYVAAWVEYTNTNGDKEQTMVRIPPAYETLTVGTEHNIALVIGNDKVSMYASLVEPDTIPKGKPVVEKEEVL